MGNIGSKPASRALILAAAASHAAGDDFGGGTKSSKSGDCTSCSADTLTRVTTLTNVVFRNVANENNEITQASIAEFCSEGPDATAALVQAVGNSAGCLVDPQCAVQEIFGYVNSDANLTITEGEFQAGAIDILCNAEQNGVILPRGGCNYTDPCETIINGGDDVVLLGVDFKQGKRRYDTKQGTLGHTKPVFHKKARITRKVVLR